MKIDIITWATLLSLCFTFNTAVHAAAASDGTDHYACIDTTRGYIAYDETSRVEATGDSYPKYAEACVNVTAPSIADEEKPKAMGPLLGGHLTGRRCDYGEELRYSPRGCGFYLQCDAAEREWERPCPPIDMHFDEPSQRCTWPHLSECIKNR